MGRLHGSVKALTIEANVSPCAHICRYCSIGDRGPKFSLDRWFAFVERFMDWANERGHDDFHIGTGFFPSFNFNIETYAALRNWFKDRLGINLGCIPLGGLKMRDEEDMRRWLIERQAVGLEGIAASFVGVGAVHDRWNGRLGDFDYLMRTLRTAAELGLSRIETLYLTKSSLPLMDELIEKLDALPTPPQNKNRQVRPFYYIGHATHHEGESITEQDRENLPRFVTDCLPREWVLRSEREWIDVLRNEEEAPHNLALHLELNAENIDCLEAMSCDEIFTDLETRAFASVARFPSLRELSETYADHNGTKIYMFAADLERLWLNRFLDANPIELDRQLLHYLLGRSLNPPPLWE